MIRDVQWRMANRVIVVIGIAASSVQLFESPLRAAEGRALLDAVVEAWQRRQEEVHTARFDWMHEHTRGPRTAVPLGSRLDDRPNRNAPKGTVCYRQEAHLSIDGNMVNYARKVIDVPPRETVLKAYRGTFDGQRSYRFSLGTMPTGTVSGRRFEADKGLLYLKPIFLAYRALHPSFEGIEPQAYRIAAESGVVDGHRCIILKQSTDAVVRNAYWVSPDMDFSVLRYTATVEGKEIIRLDIAYDRDARHGWVPTRWESVWVNPDTGALVEGGISTVTSYAINEPIPDEEFRIAFPVGTWVTDETTGQEYLVRDGGRKRVITPREKKEATYKELLSTESGGAGTSAWSEYLKWFLWLNFFCALGIFGWLAARKWKRGTRV